jgi:hypothetical protein
VTIDEFTDWYATSLTSPPGSKQGACRVCRSTKGSDFDTCFHCGKSRRFSMVADAVCPISLAVSYQSQLANDLQFYKAIGRDRDALQKRIAALLVRFLRQHEACIARASGAPGLPFEAVTTVPSTTGRQGEHPLARLVRTYVDPNRYRDLLIGSAAPSSHEIDPARFQVRTGEPIPERILLIEDTWTAGGNSQSASIALKSAGAGLVAILVVGRWIHAADTDKRTRPADQELFAAARKERPFDWNKCCYDWDAEDGFLW